MPNLYSSDQRCVEIEVAYANPEIQFLECFEVPVGTTVGAAVELSTLKQQVDGVVVEPHALGIFGEVVSPEMPLEHPCRIEVYRPLRWDPKENRRRRLQQSRDNQEA